MRVYVDSIVFKMGKILTEDDRGELRDLRPRKGMAPNIGLINILFQLAKAAAISRPLERRNNSINK